MKRIFAVIAVLCLVFSTSAVAFASTAYQENDMVMSESLEEARLLIPKGQLPTEIIDGTIIDDGDVQFDLSLPYQSTTVEIAEGEFATIGIEKVVDPDAMTTMSTSYTLSDGEWKIWVNSGVINMSYKIYIRNGRIVDAYGESVNLVGYTLVSESLTFNSVSSMYRVVCTTTPWNVYTTTAFLNAVISGNTLTVSL